MVDVDGVVEDLPGAARLPEEDVRRELAELTLVQNPVRSEQRPAIGAVELLRRRSGPARIRNAVLVEDDGNTPSSDERKKRPQVAWQPRRAQVKQCEVGRIVRKAAGEPLELGGAACDTLPRAWNTVVAVEDP